MIKKIGWWIDAICQRYKLIRKLKKISLLVPMQSALNAWKIPTFADCFFIYAYLCYLKISDVKT